MVKFASGEREEGGKRCVHGWGGGLGRGGGGG